LGSTSKIASKYGSVITNSAIFVNSPSIEFELLEVASDDECVEGSSGIADRFEETREATMDVVSQSSAVQMKKPKQSITVFGVSGKAWRNAFRLRALVLFCRNVECSSH
jgi:hypothetical protein